MRLISNASLTHVVNTILLDKDRSLIRLKLIDRFVKDSSGHPTDYNYKLCYVLLCCLFRVVNNIFIFVVDINP